MRKCNYMEFSDNDLALIWSKGNVESGYNADRFRKDDYGRWMERGEYGNRQHKWGWEVDHIRRDRHGGSNQLSNLRPLNWESNVNRG